MSRILIVEDEGMIAFGIEQDLEDAGFVVAGTCGTISAALKAIEAGNIDAVTLDGNLFGESSAPIAKRLESLNIPFVVVTGYSSGQIGDWINTAPRINKPYDAKDLINTLKRVMAGEKTIRSS